MTRFSGRFAELICTLQVPMSLDGELNARGGRPLLAKAAQPWQDLHRELHGFGYAKPEEIANALKDRL